MGKQAWFTEECHRTKTLLRIAYNKYKKCLFHQDLLNQLWQLEKSTRKSVNNLKKLTD